ncbi:MAG: hypothetical protein K2L07_04125 [Lachnospiraceae bacterium]|nr:hypothetical protein [Lachnospiraceae bacterium]
MKKFGKRLMALTMVGVLMCAPLTAFATEVDEESSAQGNITGSGDVEGIVNKDVFKVVLPTVAAGDTTFNFILDPQGLIKDTDGSKYTNATFDAAAKGLYFANPQDGGSTKYMASSPALTATNKGTVDVDVTLTATADADSLKDADKGYTIGLAADDTFANDKTTSVYLALVSGDQTAALTADGATITDTLAAAPSDAYEVTYNSTSSKYEYGLTAAAQAADYTGFKSLDFNLTGACNTDADWAVAEDAAPSVNVAWTLEKHIDELTYDKMKGDTSAITVTTYDAVKSAKLVKFNGAANTNPLTIGTNCSVSGTSFTLLAAWTTKITAETVITLTFENGRTQTLTINVIDPTATPLPLTYNRKSGDTSAISVTTFAEVKSAKLVKYNGAANANPLTIGTNCSVSGKTFTLLASWASKITAETVITLTFEDGRTQTLTVNVQ